MSASEKEMQGTINALLESQQLAVLSTQRNGQPYSSLMAFAYSADLKNIIVATGKSTRKHQNIVHDSRVSLLVDNRSNSEADFHAAMALTVVGKAELVENAEQSEYWQLYLGRHPYLSKFLSAPTTALFKIKVYHYLLVSRFQNVMEYRVEDEADLFT